MSRWMPNRRQAWRWEIPSTRRPSGPKTAQPPKAEAKTFSTAREAVAALVYPVHVICAWLGNSPKLAAKHCLQVTEGHFAQAVQEAVQKTVQRVPARCCAVPRGGRADARKSRWGGPAQSKAALRDSAEPQLVGRTGLEPVTSCVSSRRSSQLS